MHLKLILLILILGRVDVISQQCLLADAQYNQTEFRCDASCLASDKLITPPYKHQMEIEAKNKLKDFELF